MYQSNLGEWQFHFTWSFWICVEVRLDWLEKTKTPTYELTCFKPDHLFISHRVCPVMRWRNVFYPNNSDNMLGEDSKSPASELMPCKQWNNAIAPSLSLSFSITLHLVLPRQPRLGLISCVHSIIFRNERKGKKRLY